MARTVPVSAEDLVFELRCMERATHTASPSAISRIQFPGGRVPYIWCCANAGRAMRVKKSPDLSYKDVTPKSLYMGRRNFLFGVAAAYGAVVGYKKLTRLLEGPATGSTPVKLTGVTKW